MERTAPTKRVFAKLAALFVLLTALTFLVHGTASAQSIVKAQPLVPACGYEQLTNWVWNQNGEGNVNIIKWKYTCDGSVHCEAIDQTFYGGFDGGGVLLEVDAYNSSGQLVAFSDASKDPFRENDFINTAALSGGYSSYVCNPFLLNT